MRRKTLSFLLVFCMLFALFPATASADPLTGTVTLERTGNGSIGDEQTDIEWNGNTGTQELALEGSSPNQVMNAHYNITADPGYRIKSVALYTIGADTVPVRHPFELNVTSGEGGFFGRVLDGGNDLIAGSIRWFAKDGDKLAAEFERTSSSRDTVVVEGEAGLLLAQTLSGVTRVEVKDTFTIENQETTITKETEIKNGTVTISTGAILNIDGCSFGPDFTKAMTNPSKLINNGTINVHSGGELLLIDENSGAINVENGAVMEAGVINTGTITVKSGGKAYPVMGKSISNTGQFTVEAGATLEPWEGQGFQNAPGGTLTLNGDLIFNEGFWSSFSEGTLEGTGRFIVNIRMDVAGLQSVVDTANGNGSSLTIVNESVVELGSGTDFATFKAAANDADVRAIYLTNCNITINESLNITNKNIYLESAAALTLDAGNTLTLTDTAGTGFQCGLISAADNYEHSGGESTSVTVNGRLVLAGARLGGYIRAMTVGEGGTIDNSAGSIDVRYTLYCDGSITNMAYEDRADSGRLRVFNKGVVIKDGIAILGEQSGSIDTAQAEAAVSVMSVSQTTELLMDTVYETPHTPAAITLTKNLTVPAGTLLWVPKLETYGNYINIGNASAGSGTASLTVGSGKTLTIASGGILRLNGPITNNGTVLYNGSVTGEGEIGGDGLFVLAPNTSVRIATSGGSIKGVNDTSAVPTESGRGYTVDRDGKLITSHSIYAADNSLDLYVGTDIEGLLQNGAALAPPVGLAQAAVATAGLDTTADYSAKLKARLESVTRNNGMTLVYDIKPKISSNGGIDWTDIAALEGDSVNNTPVSFRLPVPSGTTESYVRIVHKNGGTVKSIDFYPILTDVSGNKYAEITTTSFSTFEMSFSNSSSDGSGDNRGGGGGGGASASSSSDPVTKGDVTTVTTEIKPDMKGMSAAAALTEESMTKTIDAAVAAAAKSNTSANINIVVDAPEKATEVKTSIPTASINKLAGADTSATLTVTTPVGAVTFDGDALASIGKTAASADITISVAEVSKEKLTPEQQTLVGDRPVIDLSVASDGRLISDFGGGSAAVSIPYTLAKGENAEGIVVWYLADDGTLTPVECSWRDGKLNFETDHFSQYVLAYFPFADLKGGEWYYENVAYAYTNKLMSGVGNDRFDPSGATTRSMIVTILWRLEGSPVSEAHGFTDVGDGMWYAGAVNWAAANGIAEGYGGKFNPGAAVTREQTAAIIYRYAAYKGYDLSGLGDLASFTDAGDVSDWAETAMKWAVKSNLLSGTGNNKIDPAGSAQRAQVAAILQRFIESTAM